MVIVALLMNEELMRMHNVVTTCTSQRPHFKYLKPNLLDSTGLITLNSVLNTGNPTCCLDVARVLYTKAGSGTGTPAV